MRELLRNIAHGNLRERNKAVEALKHLTPSQEPRLVFLLTVKNDSPFKKKIIALVRQHCPPRFSKRFMMSEELRSAASVALCELGKARGANRANLKRAFEDPRPRIRYLATFVLAEAGPNQEDIHNLITSLRDPDPAVRDWAIIALAKGGQKSHDAMQALIQIARSQSYGWHDPPYGWSHRSNACVALTRVGTSSPLVFKALADAKEDEDSRVRQAASCNGAHHFRKTGVKISKLKCWHDVVDPGQIW